jgi:hypothetical protein
LAGQILVYPEATPFYVLPVALFIGLRAIQAFRHEPRRTQEVLDWVKRWVFVLLLSALISPTAIWTLWVSFVPQVGTVALAIGGTLDTWLSFPQVFGVNALRVLEHPWLEPWDTGIREGWDVVAWGVVVGLALLLSYGLVRSLKTGRDFLAASGIALLVLTAWMLLVQNYPYGFFKTVATSLAVFIALVAFGAEALWGRIDTMPLGRRRIVATMAIVLAGLVFVLQGLAMFWFQNTLAQRAPAVTRRLIQLSNSDIVAPNAPIYLSLGRRSNPRMYWAAYLLREHPMIGNGMVGYSEIHNAEEGVVYEYALLNREENPVEFDYTADDAVWDDRWTILYRKP